MTLSHIFTIQRQIRTHEQKNNALDVLSKKLYTFIFFVISLPNFFAHLKKKVLFCTPPRSLSMQPADAFVEL